MRNTLYKAYLDDFAAFCNKLGGTTGEVMSDLLAFEADRRALNITLNSIGTGRDCSPMSVHKDLAWRFVTTVLACIRQVEHSQLCCLAA